jgi:hypothetical protein
MDDGLFETIKKKAQEYAGMLPPQDLTNAGMANRVSPQGMGGIADGGPTSYAAMPTSAGIAGDTSAPDQTSTVSPEIPKSTASSAPAAPSVVPPDNGSIGSKPLDNTTRQGAAQFANSEGRTFNNADLKTLYGGIDAPMTNDQTAASRNDNINALDHYNAYLDKKAMQDAVTRATNQPTPANLAAAGIASKVLPEQMQIEAQKQAQETALQTAQAQKMPVEGSDGKTYWVDPPTAAKFPSTEKITGHVNEAGNYVDIKGNDTGVKAGASPGGSSMKLSPEALQGLSDRFSATGQIPGMGMGKAATEARTQVLNKWAEDMHNTGTTAADQLVKQSAFKASNAELSKLQSQRGTVMAFANTAEKNLDIVDKLSDKVGRTGVPVLNRWINAGKRSVAGDPEIAQFDAAVRTAINEYAKVTSATTGGQVTSDSARKEVESMLNAAQTPEQIKAVIQILRQEMGNRKSGYDDQIKFIKDNISGKSDNPQGQQTASARGGKYAWIKEHKPLNKGASDQELSDYYDKTYGGQ